MTLLPGILPCRVYNIQNKLKVELALRHYVRAQYVVFSQYWGAFFVACWLVVRTTYYTVHQLVYQSV